MQNPVLAEKTGKAETLGTDLTGEGPPGHVDVSVPLQIGWVNKTFATHIAAEGLGPSMAQQVGFE